jgi:hypothetical protein
MRKTTLLIVIGSLSLLSCSKNVEPVESLAERKELVADMNKLLVAGDIDGAKAIFDARKDEIKARCKSASNNVDKSNRLEVDKWVEGHDRDMSDLLVGMNSPKLTPDDATHAKSVLIVAEHEKICNEAI